MNLISVTKSRSNCMRVLLSLVATSLLLYETIIHSWMLKNVTSIDSLQLNTSLSYQVSTSQITPTRLGFGYDSGNNHNYSPCGIHGTACSQRIWYLEGADNEGSFISGFSVGQQLGDTHIICNQGGQMDASTIVLRYEDSNSTATNRFSTPEHADLMIPNGGCLEIVYVNTQSSCAPPGCDPGGNRWLAVAPYGGYANRTMVNSMQLTGYITPAALTSGASVNDYSPTEANPQPSGFCGNGTAGQDCSFSANSVELLTTTSTTAATITGFAYTAVTNPAGLGPVHFLFNAGPGTIILKHQSASSLANNQMQLPNSTDYVLPPNGSVGLWHISGSGNWHTLGDDNFQPTFGAVTATSLLVNGTSTAQGFFEGAPLLSRLVPTAITSGATATNYGNGVASFHSVQHIVIQTTTSSFATLASMNAGTTGELKTICNFGPGDVLITNEDTTDATAGNRFALTGRTTLELFGDASAIAGESCAVFRYDETSRWTEEYTSEHNHVAGHLTSSGVSLTASNLSSCGTGTPAIAADSTDIAGQITEGTTTAGCTLTFARTYTAAPFCTCSSATAGVTVTCTTSPTTLVIANASASGDIVNYTCIGKRGGT